MRFAVGFVLVVVLAALAAPSQCQLFPWMPSMPEVKDLKPLQDTVSSMYSSMMKAMGMSDDLISKMGSFSMDSMKSALAKLGFPSFLYGDYEDKTGKTLTDMAKFMSYKMSELKDKVKDKVNSAIDKGNSMMNSMASGLKKMKNAVNYYTGSG